jgi:hypothetical protein
MRAELPLRLARTAAFAAVCVVLAALAHAVGGGSVPAPATAALGVGAVLLLALALGGRERSPAAINVSLVCAQLGLHELFGANETAYLFGTDSPGANETAYLFGTDSPGADSTAYLFGADSPGADGTAYLFGTDGAVYGGAQAHGQGLGGGLGMLLAHLTATLVTGWWLARGESALWALLRRLGHRLVPLPRPVVVPPVRQAVPFAGVRVVPALPVFLRCVTRRGPPLPA